MLFHEIVLTWLQNADSSAVAVTQVEPVLLEDVHGVMIHYISKVSDGFRMHLTRQTYSVKGESFISLWEHIATFWPGE